MILEVGEIVANNKNIKTNNANTKKYVNPTARIWGKIIITILAVLMCLSGLIALIYYIVFNTLH